MCPLSDTAESQDLSKVITRHCKGTARWVTEPSTTQLGVRNTFTVAVFNLRRGKTGQFCCSLYAWVPIPTLLQTYLNGATLWIPAQLPDVHKGILSCRE